MISTVIGRHRRMRCAEIVVTLLTDPCTFDPWSAFLHSSLLKCRRYLRKSEERATSFITNALNYSKLQPTPNRFATGPVSVFFYAVSDIGGELQLDPDDLRIIITPPCGPPIDLLHASKTTVSSQIRKWVRRATLGELAEQVDGEQP